MSLNSPRAIFSCQRLAVPTVCKKGGLEISRLLDLEQPATTHDMSQETRSSGNILGRKKIERNVWKCAMHSMFNVCMTS
jgi:hypothetical protein